MDAGASWWQVACRFPGTNRVEIESVDLITGIVVVTGAFLLATAIVALSASRIPLPANQDEHDLVERVFHRRARATFVTLLIGFFVGLADVLVTAQLPIIAFLNVAVGAATVAILYSTSRSHSDGENWRR